MGPGTVGDAIVVGNCAMRNGGRFDATRGARTYGRAMTTAGGHGADRGSAPPHGDATLGSPMGRDGPL